MRRTLAIVPLVGALLCPAAFGQKPVDINTQSAYCFEHADETSDKCVAGLPLIPRSGTTVEIEPLPAPSAGPGAQQIEDAYKAKLHKEGKSFLSGIAPSSTSIDFPKTQPTTTHQPDLSAAPACGANCQQTGYQQSYEAGEALGSAVSSVARGLWTRHRINSFCKTHPTSRFVTSDGISIDCPNSALDSFEQGLVDEYCADNPGSWITVGKHQVDCVTPPDPPNLKWAKWEMSRWLKRLKHSLDVKDSMSAGQAQEGWDYWRSVFCGLAPGTKYKGLERKHQRCP